MCGIRGKNSTSTLNKNTALQINNDHATSYSDDECAIMIQSRMLSLQITLEKENDNNWHVSLLFTFNIFDMVFWTHVTKAHIQKNIRYDRNIECFLI